MSVYHAHLCVKFYRPLVCRVRQNLHCDWTNICSSMGCLVPRKKLHWCARVRTAADRNNVRANPDEAARQFEEIVALFMKQMEGRHGGKKSTHATALSDRSGLKVLLPEISAAAIADLPNMGNKDGKLDTLLSNNSYTPRTLQNYLCSTKKILHWLAAGFVESQATRRQLGVECELLNATIKCLEDFIKSLNKDANAKQVEKDAAVLDSNELQLEPWMVAAFQESDVVKEAASLARQALSRTLTMSERVQVRNTLYTAVMLDQIRRAGDVNCVTNPQALSLVRQWEADGCSRDRE